MFMLLHRYSHFLRLLGNDDLEKDTEIVARRVLWLFGILNIISLEVLTAIQHFTILCVTNSLSAAVTSSS